MLVFIDESGDSGLKIESGSSRYFVVSLVIFEDNDEAVACDQRIQLLKKEIGWTQDSEFHFKKNSERIRKVFLREVSPYSFFYYGIVINKDPKKLWGEGFRSKESFYKYACGLVFENAKEKIANATIVIDESGSLDFKRQLGQYLRRKMNGRNRIVGKVKMQRSVSNNLLQLADYVASIINRSIQNKKKKSDDYRKIVSHREIRVQVWPPQ